MTSASPSIHRRRAFALTSQQLGGALGIALASSVAGAHTTALLRAGDALATALTGGFQRALWVLEAIPPERGPRDLRAPPSRRALKRREQAHGP